ncbi:MAG: hypothetical protein AAF939_13460 [Planctomycetota bacterium]
MLPRFYAYAVLNQVRADGETIRHLTSLLNSIPSRSYFSGDTMSLKFGIFLVEQRIISPEQFCGLVKIQQEASPSVATIALRKNALTIKQVAEILDASEANPEKSFLNIAMEKDFLDRADADQLLHEQQLSCPTIRKLLVECGLLTQRQASVLLLHFERNGDKPIFQDQGLHQEVEQPQAVVRTEPQQKAAPKAPKISTIQPAAPTDDANQSGGTSQQKPRQPKFRQRPVVVRQYTPN